MFYYLERKTFLMRLKPLASQAVGFHGVEDAKSWETGFWLTSTVKVKAFHESL